MTKTPEWPTPEEIEEIKRNGVGYGVCGSVDLWVYPNPFKPNEVTFELYDSFDEVPGFDVKKFSLQELGVNGLDELIYKLRSDEEFVKKIVKSIKEDALDEDGEINCWDMMGEVSIYRRLCGGIEVGRKVLVVRKLNDGFKFWIQGNRCGLSFIIRQHPLDTKNAVLTFVKDGQEIGSVFRDYGYFSVDYKIRNMCQLYRYVVSNPDRGYWFITYHDNGAIEEVEVINDSDFEDYDFEMCKAYDTIHLSNVGPIEDVEIELGDITLFIGKPNTGKSLAMREIFRYFSKKGVKNIVFLHRNRLTQTLLKLLKGSMRESEGSDYNYNYDNEIRRIVQPLFLNGEVTERDWKLVYMENDKIIPWNQVSDSVLEIMSLLLSVKNGDIVLYDEPETHLHEELQLLMGIVLYAMSTFNRVVLTTHSQNILRTIGYLSMIRPTEKELKELFDELGVKGYDDLLSAIEMANQKKVKVRIYYFTEGEVKEVSVDEAVKGMPGTASVLEKGLKWFSSLHSKRLSREEG